MIRPGSLKFVVPLGEDAIPVAMRVLMERTGAEDIRRFGPAALLLHTNEEPSVVRDWLGAADGALVVEFEKWSGCGAEVPREWLLARGH